MNVHLGDYGGRRERLTSGPLPKVGRRVTRHLRYRELPPSPTTFRQGRSRLIVRFNLLISSTTLAMYKYTYKEPPSTPPRSLRPSTSTTQTPTRPRGSSVLSPPGTARTTTTVTATGPGDTTNGNPTLITHTTISQEYASLRYPGHCPLGMYLIPDKDNMFVWDGVFFVHQGSSITHPPSRSPEGADVPSVFIPLTMLRCPRTPIVTPVRLQSILRPFHRS